MGMDLTGQSLGRYHIIEQLGSGGMAVVYKAYDTRLERDVAVKVIRRGAFPPDQIGQILKRFEREAMALAGLSHSNILKVLDYGDYDGSPYLVLEYLPGGTLKQKLKGKPIHWQQALQVIAPIASALEYAHQQGIVHRDVKPSNILLTDKGQSMLSDFGIAKILESGTMETLTGTGAGVGTPEYMAPEQWTGGTSKQSDIYSLGIVLYEMITGRRPYTADTPAAILLKQATEPLPSPGLFTSDLPEDVEKTLVKALAIKAENRYKSMSEFARVLDLLAKNSVSKMDRTAIQTLTSITTETDATAFVTYQQEETHGTRLQGTRSRSYRQKKVTVDRNAGGKKTKPVWTYILGAGIGAFLLISLIAWVALAWIDNMIGMSAPEYPSPNVPVIQVTIPAEDAGHPPEALPTVLVPTNIPPTSTIPPTLTVASVPTMTQSPTSTSTPSLQGGETLLSQVDNMVQVYLPLLGEFWIDQTEVTNAQYALCVQAGGCNPPVKSNFYDLDYFGNPRYSNYPVVFVYWSYANAYCSWAGRRLPTSQEWEAAARGVDNRAYPWGNYRPDGRLANTCDVNCTLEELRKKQDTSINDGYSFTAPVGSYPAGASPYGVLDMAGNLWEWTASSLGSYYVIRGGAWTSNWETIQSSHVSSYDPQVAWVDTGFRCAKDK